MGRRRTPKGYDGTAKTHHHLQEVLPGVLRGVNAAYKERPDLVMGAWQQVIGPSLSGMTEALHFQEGILTVKVKNSSLFSLLKQYERPRLLRKLRERFPQTVIKAIVFRAG